MASPLRVAVADDDPTTREFLGKFLPRLGYAVSASAADGPELVEACRRSPPDLIIADLKLPGMTGLEAVREVNRTASVPAILLTGHSAPEWVEQAREAGVMACLVKPVTEEQLAPAIALARRHFEEVAVLRRESAELRQLLEDRKVIERAKGAVGRRCGLGETDAYRRMRKLATDHGRRLVEVAHDLLKAEEVFRAVDSAGER